MQFIPKDAHILPVYGKGVFTSIFTDDKAKTATISLLSVLTGRDITDVRISTSKPVQKADSFRALCHCANGDEINVELQTNSDCESLEDDISKILSENIYRLSKLHTSQTLSKAKASYRIVFYARSVLPNDKYINRFTLTNDTTSEPLDNSINLIFIELSKLRSIIAEPVEDMSDTDKWVLFLNFANDPAVRKKMNKIIETSPELQTAAELLVQLSKTNVGRMSEPISFNEPYSLSVLAAVAEFKSYHSGPAVPNAYILQAMRLYNMSDQTVLQRTGWNYATLYEAESVIKDVKEPLIENTEDISERAKILRAFRRCSMSNQAIQEVTGWTAQELQKVEERVQKDATA